LLALLHGLALLLLNMPPLPFLLVRLVRLSLVQLQQGLLLPWQQGRFQMDQAVLVVQLKTGALIQLLDSQPLQGV
jgi:hypothetical protein